MADKFQLKALITGVDKLSPMLNGIQKKAGSFRKHLEKSGLGKVSFGEAIAGGAFAVPFITGVKAAMAFESKMADVKKVVDFDKGLEGVQLAGLNKDVLALSRELPMAASGIAEIYAAGGQSGIARTELKAFATDAIKMGVAFDQTAAESGKMMAVWRTSFKLGQDGVVELADKINHLGNNGPATTKQISAIVTRVGALGGVAGMSTGQVAAMGAALTGVGVSEEIAATGIKNFTLALNAGSSATKGQAQMFKALRLDSKSLSKGMQTDAQGTMVKVLKAISKVDKDKQMAVLATIFGKESIESIAPMLTNLDLLEKNFRLVGDATEYSGSMQKEYAARAATTENNLQLLTNRATELGIAVGNALLPPFNDFMGALGPIVTGVADLTAANPWLVKTVLGAAVGFGVLRLAVMGGVAAMKLFGAVTTMSPVGLIVRGIAVAAGLVIANWDAVGPYFKAMWDYVSPLFELGWLVLKEVFAWSPLGLIIDNWEPIVKWFQKMWERIKPYVGWIGDAANWVRGNAVSAVADAKVASLGIDPAVAKNLGSLTNTSAADTSASIASAVRNGGSGAFAQRESPLASGGAFQKQNLQGEMVMRFENAPPGLQVQSVRTNQSGFDIKAPVGTRSLSLPY